MHIRCPNCHQSIVTSSDIDQTLTDVQCPSCKNVVKLVDDPAQLEASIPKRIAQFELIKQLGVGAFGSVWLANDTELHRQVAIKIPRKTQLTQTEAEQFLREARAAAQLTHQNIIGIHEVGREGSLIYIVSDYVNGQTLADVMSQRRFTHYEAAEICAKIADALHHAHERGVIHRDLKPGNIMMDDRGEPHIMDFGIAKQSLNETAMTVEGQILGTPAYMPPEQADGDAHRVDRRADVYSLGVILYEMLTGERPFRGNIRTVLYQVIHEDAPPLRKFDRGVPRDLENICLKCLEKSKRRRYDTAADLADDLRRWQQKLPIKARPLGPIARTVRWSQRNPALATAVGLIIIVTLAGFTGVTTLWLKNAQAYQNEALARAEAKREAEEAQIQRVAAEKATEEARLSAQKAEQARRETEKALAEVREQKRIADAEKERAEEYAALLQNAIDDAKKQAENAEKQRNAAEIARQNAVEARRAAEAAQEQARKAQEELAQAASKAYLDLSRQFLSKGDYELVIANYRAALERGVVSDEHRALFEESLREKLENLDADTPPESLSLQERITAANLYVTLAIASSEKGEFTKALELMNRAQTFDPEAKSNEKTYRRGTHEIRLKWAKHLQGNQKFEEALKQLQLAKDEGAPPAAVNAGIAELYSVQAQTEVTAGDYESAINLLNKAIQANPPSKATFQRQMIGVYLQKAEDLVNQQKPMDAAEAYLQAATIDDDHGGLYRQKAALTLKQAGQSAASNGNRDQALALLKRAAEVDPENRSDYLREATVMLETDARAKIKQGQYVQAADQYVKAAEFDPTNATTLRSHAAMAYFNFAKKLQNEQKVEEAISALDKAVQLNPGADIVEEFVKAHTKRALAYYEQRKFDEAIADYTAIINVQPNNVRAFLSRGVAYHAKRDFDKALADYDAALRIDSNNLLARRYRAEIHLTYRPTKSKQLLEQTVADLEAILGAGAGTLDLRRKLAYLLAASAIKELRDGKRAVFHAEQVCEATGWKQPDDLALLASAHAQAGNVDEAVKWMQQAMEKAPDNSAMSVLLARYRDGQPPP